MFQNNKNGVVYQQVPQSQMPSFYHHSQHIGFQHFLEDLPLIAGLALPVKPLSNLCQTTLACLY